MKGAIRICIAAAAIMASCPGPAVSSDGADGADGRLNAFLDAAYAARADLSPQLLTTLGSKTAMDRLDDYSAAGEARRLALVRAQVVELRRSFDPRTLNPNGRLSYLLFEDNAGTAERNHRWRDHLFVFTALGSPATDIPAFLINVHHIGSEADAEAYIARLRDVRRALRQVASELDERAARHLLEPHSLFPPSIAQAKALIVGAPFDDGPDNPLWVDFRRKIATLDLSPAQHERLTAEARAALLGPYRNGYRTVLTSLKAAERATARDPHGDGGVWRLSDGGAFYASRLRIATTTHLNARQINAMGMAEMADVKKRMAALAPRLGLGGPVSAMLARIKVDPHFRYVGDGGDAYVDEARRDVARVMKRAPVLFERLPQASLEVRAVEPWRAATAPSAEYSRGAPDGSRPGILYVNPSNPAAIPRIQTMATACHEGAPGHHFQTSLALEDARLPRFRRNGPGYTAFGEGWALYSERLCGELGLYDDAADEMGALSLEALRAGRLVVDTGLHARHWPRRRAIAYLQANTLLSHADAVREVDRYLSVPGQATSYEIGLLHILALRRRTETALGARFDVRAFHSAILGEGGLPLGLLDGRVSAYIRSRSTEFHQ